MAFILAWQLDDSASSGPACGCRGSARRRAAQVTRPAAAGGRRRSGRPAMSITSALTGRSRGSANTPSIRRTGCDRGVGEAVAGADRGEGVGAEALQPLPGRRAGHRVEVAADDQRHVRPSRARRRTRPARPGAAAAAASIRSRWVPATANRAPASSSTAERRTPVVQFRSRGEGDLVSGQHVDRQRGQHQVRPARPAAGDPAPARPGGPAPRTGTASAGTAAPPGRSPRPGRARASPGPARRDRRASTGRCRTAAAGWSRPHPGSRRPAAPPGSPDGSAGECRHMRRGHPVGTGWPRRPRIAGRQQAPGPP